MKDKKTFGLFIKQKRIEKNYSQKDLAELLYVTESAVSKWERGVTYPDITLISSICKVLDITEHELIESSNDEEYREIKTNSRKYVNLKKTLFWILNISYLAAILTCFIVNLASDHKLSWFFIVLTSIICGYTFCPTLTWVYKEFKKVIFISSTILSLFFLFLTISIYTANYWFMIPTMGVLLAYFIIFYPILFTCQKNYLSEEKYSKLTRIFLLGYSTGILILIILLLVCINGYIRFNLGLGVIITVGCMILPIVFGIMQLCNVSKKVNKIVILSVSGFAVVLFIISLVSAINLLSTVTTNTYTITDEFNKISIGNGIFDAATYDVEVYVSETNENKLVCDESEKVKISYEVINEVLTINQTDDRAFYEMMGLGIDLNLKLYLSKTTLDSLNIKSSTGDVLIDEGFTFSSVKVNISTGDVTIKSDITNSLNIEVSTGDIRILDSNLGDVIIKSSTGDNTFENVNCNSLDGRGSTGDFKFKNTILTNDLKLIVSTGDVKFDGIDAANIYITTSTGDVLGTILSPIIFNVTADNESYPDSTTGGICKIKTSTGSVKISYK